VKQVLCHGSPNVKHHRTKFSRPGDQAPRIFVLLNCNLFLPSRGQRNGLTFKGRNLFLDMTVETGSKIVSNLEVYIMGSYAFKSLNTVVQSTCQTSIKFIERTLPPPLQVNTLEVFGYFN